MFEELSKDLQDKARACKTAEELTALAASEGFELTDEMLDAVSGGITDETCIQLDGCMSYCQIFEYYGRARDGVSYQCTWVRHSDQYEPPATCMEVTGL